MSPPHHVRSISDRFPAWTDCWQDLLYLLETCQKVHQTNNEHQPSDHGVESWSKTALMQYCLVCMRMLCSQLHAVATGKAIPSQGQVLRTE